MEASEAFDWVDEAIRRHLEKHPPEPPCEHEFGSWREFDDGRGGEQFCQKCGLGAMAHTLSLDWG